MANITEFKNTFETIITDIISELKVIVNDQDTLEQVEHMLRYNVPHKPELRGFLVPMTYVEIMGEGITAEQKHNAYLLGWAFQLLQASMGMIDDYFDNGDFRFGQPTWHNLNDNSALNVNDGILMSEMAFKVVHKNFSEHPAYMSIIRLLSDMNYNYYLGQRLEFDPVSKSNDDSRDEKYFSMERHKLLSKLIIAGFMFPPPQQLALLLAGYKPSDPLWIEVQDIGVQISYYYSVLDDYLDSYGKNLINPIIDADIKKGKPTWLIIKAKELCSPDQWKTIMASYGKDDETEVQIVKRIFESLDIPALCQTQYCELKEELEGLLTKRDSEGKKVCAVFRFIIRAVSKLDE